MNHGSRKTSQTDTNSCSEAFREEAHFYDIFALFKLYSNKCIRSTENFSRLSIDRSVPPGIIRNRYKEDSVRFGIFLNPHCTGGSPLHITLALLKRCQSIFHILWILGDNPEIPDIQILSGIPDCSRYGL